MSSSSSTASIREIQEDELDPVHPARKALSDEDGGTRTEHAANLVCGGRQVRDVVNDEGEPRRIRRLVRQR